MYQVEVMVYDRWWTAKRSLKQGRIKIYEDEICIGHCHERMIQDVRVVKHEN